MENSARAVIAGKSHPTGIVACVGDHSHCYPTAWQEDSQVSWGALPLAILIRRALWMQPIKVSLLMKRERRVENATIWLARPMCLVNGCVNIWLNVFP